MAKPLNERIAAARSGNGVRTSDLEALIAEVETERDAAIAAAAQAHADSLNFELTEAARDEAAELAQKAGRNATALSAAIDDLTRRLAARMESDQSKARAAERDAILAERDALAGRLAQRWPEIEREVVELLSAIKANDARMQAALIHEASAEAVARGCAGNFMVGPQAMRRLTEIKLPSFTEAGHMAWPVGRHINSTVAIDMAAIRAEQIAAKERAEAAELASWRPYRIRPTNRAQFWTQLYAKHSAADPVPSRVDIYNTEPNAMAGETEREAYELFLKAEVAESLERNGGFIVEALDQAEAAA